MEYYAFVTGLPDLVFDEQYKVFTIKEYREEVDEKLSARDRKILKNLLLRNDNDNVISYLIDGPENASFKELSIYSKEDIATMIEDAQNEEWKSKYPNYFYRFLLDYFEKEEPSYLYLVDHLAGLYFDHLCKVKNRFLAEWAELNMNIRNTMTALSCRQNGTEYAYLIVGENEVAEVLRTAANPSHNLIELMDYYDDIKNIAEMKDILEKEQAIDQFLWNWVDENTVFHYFDIEKIMGYFFKFQIIERWRGLDKGKGKQLFREMVGELRKGVEKLECFDNQ